MSMDQRTNNLLLPDVTFKPPSVNIPATEIYGSSKPNPSQLRTKNLSALASAWIVLFNSSLDKLYSDPGNGSYQETFKNLFLSKSTWKDHLGFEFDFHTFSNDNNDGILKNVIKFKESKVGNFKVDKLIDPRNFPGGIKLTTIHEGNESNPPIEWLHVFVTFKSKLGFGRGIVRLVSVDDDNSPIGLKALSIYTLLEGLDDPTAEHIEKLGHNRPPGVNHGQHKNRKSWVERRQEDMNINEQNEPVVLIIGGGQGGLTTAARLKSFGIRSLIIEKNKKIGDNWRNRYKFLVLHDPVWYDHLPYINFPPTWPIFTPKDKLGDWFESYARSMELNVWNETTVKSTVYHPETKSWTVEIANVNDPTDIKVVHPNHIILATGHSGEPNIPTFKGQEIFKGKICHSSQHTTGADWKGKNAIVVGSCNSAHDICQDFYEQGAKVTMIQRSHTCVISSGDGLGVICKGVYEEDGPPVDVADMLNMGNPLALTNLIGQQQTRQIAVKDKATLDGLAKAGFKLDYGYGGTGLFGKYFRRGGGYYIDVGCSKLIIEGHIKVKGGQEIDHFTESGVVFKDGSVIDNLDIVVLATGYRNMKDTARKIFGDTVADKLNPIWGYDEEGETKVIWRQSGHEHFWYMGGNLALSRYYSKRLALQIVGSEMGYIP